MANGHGGSRNGAGRKKGSKNTRSREIADRAVEQGITPLEVILQAMRRHYDRGDLDTAAEYAKDAAPYCHPRLSSVQMQTDATVTVVEDRGWYSNQAHELTNGDGADHNPASGAAPSGAGTP